jgi:hypothetical protein
MKTKTINLYQFSELTEQAQEKAINKLYDINVDYQWYDFTEDDAHQIGLNIKEFDIERRSFVKGEFTLSASEVAQNIFNNHGEECETYKTAQNFMNHWQPIFNNYMDENHKDYESGESESKMIDLEDEFLQSLCEDYRIILTKEYEYLTSKEAIIETIEANEYDFDEEGNLI